VAIRRFSYVCAITLAACSDGPPEPIFAVVGPTHNQTDAASAVGLFQVTADPAYTFKFGDGPTDALDGLYELDFKTDPPEDALNAGGFGVAQVALLRGNRTTLPDGVVDLQFELDGLSTQSAIVFRAPGALGPDWTLAFPEGWSCGACQQVGAGMPDIFVPTACENVVVERFVAQSCAWF
jgi:hypothetical protein